MSRGLGQVQRGVLAALAEECHGDGWLTVPELTARVVGPEPSRSEAESVRRAVKRLGRSGRVDLDYLDAEVVITSARVPWGDHIVYRRRHRGYRSVLAAHWPLSVEERQARAQLWAASLDRLIALNARIDEPPC